MSQDPGRKEYIRGLSEEGLRRRVDFLRMKSEEDARAVTLDEEKLMFKYSFTIDEIQEELERRDKNPQSLR